MPFSKKFIDDVRAATDIVQIVGKIIELRQFNRDRHKGLCPFHNESNPSFQVSNGLYYCFGCGEGGDAIRFVQKTQELSFGDAVRRLADAHGVKDDDTQPSLRFRRPIKKVLRGILPSINYTPPSASFKAAYDPYAAELFADLYQPDYDLLLTLGIVPSHLILELLKNVGMSHL